MPNETKTEHVHTEYCSTICEDLIQLEKAYPNGIPRKTCKCMRHGHEPGCPQSVVCDGCGAVDEPCADDCPEYNACLIVLACKQLLRRCDGARAQDGAGFNRFDAAFVRTMPLDSMTPKQNLAVYNMLRKYKAQLKRMGIDYDKIAKPVIPDAPPPIDMAAIRAKLAEQPAKPKPAAPEQPRRISIEDNRFIIEFPYNQTDIDRVKKLIPGARYEDKNGRKCWWATVGVGTAEGVRELSKFIPVSDGVNEVAAGVIAKAVVNTTLSRSDTHWLDMGEFLKTPRPFQFGGIQYLADNERAFIADDMGLGKTIQALGGLHYLGIDRALVISPASLKINWGIEAASCLPGAGRMFFSFRKTSKKHYNPQGEYLCTEYPYAHARVMKPDFLVLVVDSKAPDDLVDVANLVVINYDLLSAGWFDQKKKQVTLTPLAERASKNIKALVCDESHYVKTEKAQRTCATKKISRDIKYRALLTGTPIDNRPLEIISQLDILDRLEEFGGSWKFKQRYCGAHQIRVPGRGMAWDFSGASNLSELNAKLRATCFIRRKKADVLSELPPKTWVELPFELTNRKEYTKAEKDLMGYVKEITYLAEKERLAKEGSADADTEARASADLAVAKAARAQVLVGIGVLRRLCAEGKMSATKQWVADFMESDEKLVVFAHHIEIQKQLLQEFKQWGAVSVMGADSPTVRAEAVSRFQNDPGCRIIVVSLSAGAEGITLTAASTVLFVEHPWTPGKKAQAEDRCHRIGQANNVTIYDTVAPMSFDEDLTALLKDKSEIVAALADGDQTTSASQLQEILSRIAARN